MCVCVCVCVWLGGGGERQRMTGGKYVGRDAGRGLWERDPGKGLMRPVGD